MIQTSGGYFETDYKPASSQEARISQHIERPSTS